MNTLSHSKYPLGCVMSFSMIFLISMLNSARGQGELTQAELTFFETKVRPVLVERCYSCHSEDSDENQGGLLLDSRDGMRRGGASGPAVTPGNVQASLLISAIRHANDDLMMPPEDEAEKLSDNVIRDFETWVRMGAPDPRDGPAKVVTWHDTSDARHWWSFQPIQKVSVPTDIPAQHVSWPKTDIDRLVAARWESHGVSPVADADPITLLRRLRFDLTGLPPSEKEAEYFVKQWNEKPEARDALLERVVEWMLNSHEYAERWGRRWLDVARYAESSGKDVNLVYPHAWRYRDYVIESFHKDKPYDQFLREQIAGDLLSAENAAQRAEQLTATAFLAIGENPINERNPRQFAVDLADDQVGTVTQAFLGITVACARCHDHRFDPVSQRDYTSLAGIFLSTETKYGTAGAVGGRNRADLIELPPTANLPVVGSGLSTTAIRQKQAKLEQLQQQQRSARAQRAGGGQADDGLTDFDLVRINTQISQLEFELSGVNEDGSAKPLAMGVSDRPVTAPRTRGPGGQGGRPMQADNPTGPRRMLGPGMQRPRQRGRGQRRPGQRGPSQRGPSQRGPSQRVPGQREPGQRGPIGQSQFRRNPFADGENVPPNRSLTPRQAGDDPGPMMTEQQNRRVRSSGFEQIGNSPLFLRGSIDNAGDPVPRGIPALLGSGKDVLIRNGSGRLELADALVSQNNTLTSRVIVNRVWHWLFGRGLVESVDNFGTTGGQLSHPELLDYLANRFMDHGWSIKQLIREITTSRVYRLSASHHASCFAADPDNAMLWRHSSRRLEAEELRDGILAASGQLDLRAEAASMIGRAGDGPIGGLRFQAVTLDEIASADNHFRSIYLPATRSVEPNVLAAFDPPNSSVSDGSRDATNVPAQALFMLNSDFVAEHSQALADLSLQTHPGNSSLSSFSQRLDFVFRRVLNRQPIKAETDASKRLIQPIGDPRSAWTSVVRGLFGSAEFRFVD